MKDPKRLSARDTTAFENRLLGAARSESIPNEMKLRMSQGLNLGAAATAAHAFVSLKTAALIVVGTAAMAGLVVFGLGVGAHHESAAVTAQHSPTPPAAATPGPVTLPPATAPAELPLPTIPQPPVPAHASHALTSPNREIDLREEIGLLDAARAALAAGAPQKALAALGQYNHRYPHGTFAPEALALRIEALTNTGDAVTARALARRFLKAYPGSPLAERVEYLASLGR